MRKSIRKIRKFYTGGIAVYPKDEAYKEVSYISYYFHWPFDEVMQLDHLTRRRFCSEIGLIHKQVTNAPKNIFEI